MIPSSSPSRRAGWIHLSKWVAALTLIAALILIAKRDLAPGLKPHEVLLYGAGVGLGVVVLVSLASVLGGYWNQFSLKHGATDAQWLGLPRGQQPPGLERLSAETASKPPHDAVTADSSGQEAQ